MWKNWDGTTLETDEGLRWQETPSYNGATPARPADDNYIYTFSGWSPAVTQATADAVYTATYTQVTLDQAAADAVIAKIDAIGTVVYTDESKAKIDAARAAYDALTAAGKALVTNYTTLTAAEAEYALLEDIAANPFTFRIINGSAVITGYRGEDTALTIPDEIGGYTVTAIDPSAFKNNSSITRAIIPDSVTGIYTSAFEGCTALTDVTVGNGVMVIDQKAFYGCTSLTELTIGSSVMYIGQAAVNTSSGTSALTEVTFVRPAAEGTLQIISRAFPAGATLRYSGDGRYALFDADHGFAEGAALKDLNNKTLTWKSAYTITWLNDDGSVIDVTAVEPGKMPTHADAVKAEDAQYAYTFAGWTPAIVAATGDATYRATFDAVEAAAVKVWNGTVPTSAPSGYDESQSTITLDSAEDFVWFFKRVGSGTTYSGKTVILTVDIDLNGYNFGTVWANAGDTFEGVFDGQDHTVSNFTFSSGGQAYRWTLFRNVKNATIKNLRMENVAVSASASTGHAALVGMTQGSVTIENVHIGSGSVTGGSAVGGIVGQNKAAVLTVRNCSNAAAITAYAENAGGIVGASTGDCNANTTITVEDCVNTGAVTAADKHAGGIYGSIEPDTAAPAATFTNCLNTGTLTAPNGKTGGICGNSTSNVSVTISGAPGDVDGDGAVGLGDVALLSRYIAGGWNVTVDETAADVNKDGNVDLKDVILIRRFLAGGWNVELK